MSTACPDPWFRRFRAAGRPASRLVCLPHAGGAPSTFRAWARTLPAEIDLLAACYPGRQDRVGEPCLESMTALADAVTEALLPYTDLPFALFGHSMGASLAHEVALRLRRAGAPGPSVLLVSGRRAPHLLVPRAAHLGDAAAVVADVRRLSAAGGAVLDDPELRELVLPAIRADYRVVGTYRPGPVDPLDLPVVAYVGDRDPDVSVVQAGAWSTVTTGPTTVRVFPGDHFYLVGVEDELVADVAARATAAVRHAAGAPTPTPARPRSS